MRLKRYMIFRNKEEKTVHPKEKEKDNDNQSKTRKTAGKTVGKLRRPNSEHTRKMLKVGALLRLAGRNKK